MHYLFKMCPFLYLDYTLPIHIYICIHTHIYIHTYPSLIYTFLGFLSGKYIFGMFPNHVYVSTLPFLKKASHKNGEIANIVREIYNLKVSLPSFMKFLPTTYNHTMEIFYINLNSSIARNNEMQLQLSQFGYPFQRIEAINLPSISSISYEYNLSQAMDPCETPTEPLIIDSSIYHSSSIKINKLCIHNTNFMKEIVCTLSHIKAIIRALTSNSTNNYALIMEDDMIFPFSVDFDSFISYFPSDFGIIQLFVMNPLQQANLLQKYIEKVYHVAWGTFFWSTGI